MTDKVINQVLLIAVLLVMSLPCHAQLLKRLQKGFAADPSPFTENEGVAAIREALKKGTQEGVALVSAIDGYYKNPDLFIPFPPEAEQMSTKLRSAGFGNQVDRMVLTMNRAAERAASEAAPIFLAAIEEMSIQDATKIIRGPEDAATRYLNQKAAPQLTEKFRPVISHALQEVEATRYWSDLVNLYNRIPLVEKLNPDLEAYVTEQAIKGLFVMIAREELRIRKDPVARTTELLKKVFSSTQ